MPVETKQSVGLSLSFDKRAKQGYIKWRYTYFDSITPPISNLGIH